MINQLIEGLTILKKYYNNPSYQIAAEHEQILCLPTDHPLSPEDTQKMKELGWFQPEQEEEGTTEYDPRAGWSMFV